MAENTTTRYFYKLLKLHTKKVRYEHHNEFLADCVARDVVPEGLRLHKTANLESFSDEFENNWMNILNGASRQMRDLVLTESRVAVQNITKHILDLEECIVKDYGIPVRDHFIQKILAICGKLKVSLSQRRRTKLDKLCIIYQSQNEDEHVSDTTATVDDISGTPLALDL